VTSFPFPIEGGQIALFARAIGDANPAFVLGPGQQVPPTYWVVADHYDPAFQRRPSPGRPWPNEGQTPILTGNPPLHVAQTIEHLGPVPVGDVLTATRQPPVEWVKQGRRGGRLHFVELVTSFADAAGRPVARSSWLDVITETSHREMSTAGGARADGGDGDDGAGGADALPLVEHLSRTQIVMYVGAAGDFHPLHHDDTVAAAAGYPSIFAPGMLTMAIACRMLTDRYPAARLRRIAARFHAQVWPGDSLWGRIDPDGDGLALDVRNQSGSAVLSATVGL
jgi:acyl dehydratase